MSLLETFDIDEWENPLADDVKQRAVTALEAGRVLYFPTLSFPLYNEEEIFLSTEQIDPKSKNISYDIRNDRLGGSLRTGEEAQELKEMLKRYAVSIRKFLAKLIPHYASTIIQAKTSFRPVEIFGRHTSYKKNDALLHVDSFPSSPTKGCRILRMFTNINPEGKPRIWRVGEPFPDVVQKMAPRVSSPVYGISHLLKLLKITKDYRTDYDHYMLKMHDAMKGDSHYQKAVSHEEIHFPPGCSWMVFTDQVSHAAISGQYVLEQTFNLPVEGLKNPATAPLRVLERYLGKSLV